MEVPDETLCFGRLALVLETTPLLEGIGFRLLESRPWAFLRSESGLAGGRPADGITRFIFLNRRDVGYLHSPRTKARRVQGASPVCRGGFRAGRGGWREDRRAGHLRQASDLPEGVGSAAQRSCDGRLEVEDAQRQADRKDVEELLSRLRASSWAPAPAVGEGEEFRYDPGPETHASALVCGGAVLHGSVVLAS